MCLFCDIAAHRFEANIVYETERTISFLDIAPANEGHTLIIPKIHVDSILDLPDEYVTDIIDELPPHTRDFSRELGGIFLNFTFAYGIISI